MAEIPHLDIEAAIEDGIGRLRLAGELDLAGCEMLTSAFERFVRESVDQVAVDAGAVSFLDSSGLRALLAGHRTVTEAGAGWVIEQISPAVERLLDVTGTRQVLLPD